MRRPGKFASRGIYRSGPVDTAKEVVLFVHGARGTPRDFVDVAGDLDPSRHQAWFVYYASGGSIVDNGSRLAADVLDLMSRHGITRIRVFAHSVGGLVAWQAVADLERHVTVVQFIAVNTPWGGHRAARFGAWLSPSPLPLWKDLVPGSRTLVAIADRKLVAPFTLVYTLREDRLRSAGDGTVSRTSQTLPVIEGQAVVVVREIGTHTSVLRGATAQRMSLLIGTAPD